MNDHLQCLSRLVPDGVLSVGRKRQRRVLEVYVGSSKIGQYSRAPGGATTFRYDPAWLSSDRAFPISLSMPLSDRTWQEGVLYRLPQEDICQALGVPPLRKYQSDGGPGIVEVKEFLNGINGSYDSRWRAQAGRTDSKGMMRKG